MYMLGCRDVRGALGCGSTGNEVLCLVSPCFKDLRAATCFKVVSQARLCGELNASRM